MASVEVPCVKLPELPDIPVISLLGGAKLSALLDFSKGMPDNCSVHFNLLAQLQPVLAALVPLLNILCVIQALAKFASNPLVNGPDLLASIEKVAGMFITLTPPGIAIIIVDILRLIIGFLNCFIDILKSNLSFQADIGLSAELAEKEFDVPNLALEASIECAQVNAGISMDQAMATLSPLEPLLDIVNSIAGIAGLELALPSLDVSAGADSLQVVEDLEAAIESIEAVIDALPV